MRILIAIAVPVVALCLSACLSAQTATGPTPLAWVCDTTAQSCRLVPLQGATEQTSATGQRVVVLPTPPPPPPVPPPAPVKTYEFGVGLLTVTNLEDPAKPVQVFIDTALFLTYSPRYPILPITPGTCEGATGVTADRMFMYFCVPSGDGKTFVRARVPVQTQW